MLKPLHLLAAVCCMMHSFAQRTDTLVLFYKTDKYALSNADKQKLDNFLKGEWDRYIINGYTDETDETDYNIELSKRRSGEVYNYVIKRNIPAEAVVTAYFGESKPQADNATEEGRALNRRTEIVGLRFPRISRTPPADPMKPVTRTLDNGFVITYEPGSLPDYLAANFEAGTGSNFQLITNTTEMRQNNLYNNTTNGEILSSVLIICGSGMNPCKLDKPVLVKVPIPYKTSCPIQKVKFFNAVAERGKLIWQEESKTLYPEVIGGVQYIHLWIDDFCQCINFDFKVDPDCYDLDSTRVQWVNRSVRNITAEIVGLNSVYMPRKMNDSTHSIIYLKDKQEDALISFALYDGSRRVKGFKNKKVSAFPYDSVSQTYQLTSAMEKFYFPKLEVWDVVLKVNGDRYRVPEEKNRYNFTYLKYNSDSILVDFTLMNGKKLELYRDQPLSSLPLDPATGYRVIDKKFLREQRLQKSFVKR